MKAIIVFFIVFINNLFCTSNWKEGDIVFQISKSNQSSLIQYATCSPWSHCGIIIEKNNCFYVLEASNVTKLTPINDWIKKGRGSFIKTRRVLNKDVKIKYSKYLGKPYDLAFKFNNNKYYCSELVWLIYKEQFGIELCKPRKVKQYNLIGIKKHLIRRNINENQLVVAPCDLLH